MKLGKTIGFPKREKYMSLDVNRYMLERLTAYPTEQWRLAMSNFGPPSNRPPLSFWRDQRNNAIAWLSRYDVVAKEIQGRVYIGDTQVDSSYVEASNKP